MIFGLADWQVAAWWAALGGGLAIVLVVGVLLEALRRTVHEIRRGVDGVLAMGGRLAQNTWTVQLLKTTRARGLDVVEELRGQTGPAGRR